MDGKSYEPKMIADSGAGYKSKLIACLSNNDIIGPFEFRFDQESLDFKDALHSMPDKNQTICGACDRPAPIKAVMCPYCGAEIPHPAAWLFARRIAPWAMAIALAAAALARGAALSSNMADSWRLACDSAFGKLFLAVSLGLAIAPPASGFNGCERAAANYLSQLLVGLAASAWGFLLPRAPKAAWVPLLLALISQTAIRATRDIEPWRILPAALIPLAIIM